MKRKFLLTIAFGLLIGASLTACQSSSNLKTVKFNVNTTYQTNKLTSVSVLSGKKIKKPSLKIIEDNPDNYQVYSWHTSKKNQNDENVWNFKKDEVTSNMTLYANWKKVYTVNYVVNGETVNSVNVFDGDKVKEHPEYLVGFSYYGTYTDSSFENEFSYDSAITSNLNLYMKRSDSIDLYETNPTGGLFENLEMCSSSDKSGTPEVPEVGTISRVKNTSGQYEGVLLDFGYSPDYADPFFEFAYNLDISKSQVIHLKLKNYGSAPSMKIYFTSFLDIEKYIPSTTGVNYNENFTCTYTFDSNEKNMTDEDDYIDVSFDLAANSMFNGYSVWGTSPYLGKLRIQSNYQSKNKDDKTNRMLLSRIYGTSYPVETKDSELVSSKCSNASALPSQEALGEGFIFPKDSNYVVCDSHTQIYNREDGMLMHFSNEVEMRSSSSKVQSIKIQLPSNDGLIDPNSPIKANLDNYKTLYLEMQNFGYVNQMDIVVYSEQGGETYSSISFDTQMSVVRKFSLNLSKAKTLSQTLLGIEFRYTAVGCDNAILLKSAYFGETKPYDIPGISFDDLKCFNLTEANNKATISYNKNFSATVIKVNDSTAEVTSNKNNISLTNKGYYTISLQASKPSTSSISHVYVSFKINGSYQSEYDFELTQTQANTYTQNLILSEGGTISNVKFRFDGTGDVRINFIRFGVDNAYCFDLAKDSAKNFYSDWIRGFTYSYTSTMEASTFTADESKTYWGFSAYLGIGNQWYGDKVYNCKNLKLAGKTKVIIVYNNSTNGANITFRGACSASISGNPDSESLGAIEKTLTLKTNMGEYEWDAAEVTIPSNLTNYYLGKLSFNGYPTSLNIRLISVI